MKKLTMILITSCFLLIIAAFGIECQEERAPAPVVDKSEQMPPLSDKLNVDFFLDGTLSMQGFVNPGDFTRYVKTLQTIESITISCWPDNQPTFSKFGAKILPLENREYLKAVLPSFYNDKEIEQQTHIDKVIDAANKNHLTIIITDLFQNDSDATFLITLLRDKFIKSGLTVGVLGLRSEYRGRIYDIGINHQVFDYDSTTNAGQPRPFYLLMLGKHADIVYYYEKLKQNNPKLYSVAQFCIFSPFIVNPLPAFAEARIESIKKVKMSIAGISNLVNNSNQDNRIRQFILRGKTAGFKVTLNYDLLPYTAGFDIAKPDCSINSINYYNKKSSILSTNDALTIDEIKVSNKTITLNLIFQAAKMPNNGINCFEIILQPQFSMNNIPGWFTEWDMNDQCVIARDGSKTLNLQSFLTGLCQTNWQVHKPKMVHIYCYIKKE